MVIITILLDSKNNREEILNDNKEICLSISILYLINENCLFIFICIKLLYK